jgi:hypothetical protein
MIENDVETAAAPVARRGRLRSLLLGVVLLACGAAIGSVTATVVIERQPPHGVRRGEHLPELIAQKMKDKYGLTDDQKLRLQAIFEEHGKRLSDIRAEVQPRVEAEHDALRKGVETVLTPEQAADWRNEFEQMRRPWHLRGSDSGGPRERSGP